MSGIFLIIACTLFVAFSNTLFKLGARQIDFTKPWQLFQNRFVLLGICTTLGSFLFNVSAYRFGDISALAPLLRLTLVWNMLGAVVLFKEKLNSRVLLGTSLILGGVFFLAI